MTKTSISLLDRLRAGADSESDSWQQFMDIYTPLLRSWIGRYEMQPNDVDDLVQEVMIVVLRELPAFRHSGRRGAFRAWLRMTVANRLRNFWRARRHRPVVRGGTEAWGELDQLTDPYSNLSRLWDHQHDQHVTRQLLRLIEGDFTPNTWQAFRLVVLDGAKADQAAAELKMSVNAVFIAKSRVLSRLREVGRGLVN